MKETGVSSSVNMYSNFQYPVRCLVANRGHKQRAHSGVVNDSKCLLATTQRGHRDTISCVYKRVMYATVCDTMQPARRLLPNYRPVMEMDRLWTYKAQQQHQIYRACRCRRQRNRNTRKRALIKKEIITYWREQFDFELPSVILARHTSLFLDELCHCDNCLIKNVMHT